MQTRRAFLATTAAAAAPRLGWAAAGSPRFLAAARSPDQTYALFGLDDAGTPIFSLPLPARGHAAAGRPDKAEAVAFARRV